MRLNALLRPAAPPRAGRRLAAAGLLAGLAAASGAGALATAETAQDAAPRVQPGYKPTPEPAFLKRWGQASRRNGLRSGVDRYTGALALEGPAPADYPVLVDGRRAAPGQDLGALGPVAAVEVDRTFERASSPRSPRVTEVRIQRAQAGPEPQAAPPVGTDPAAPTITRPNWAARPGGEDLERLYPAAAKAAGLSGRATIQCAVEAAGTLSGCSVVSEAPAGAGFGAATLALAERFRMSPRLQDGRPAAGGVVRVPVLWRLADDAPAPGARSPVLAPLPSQETPAPPDRATLDQLLTSPTVIAVSALSFRHEPGPPPRTIYEGEVEARGRPAGPVFVDGQAAPSGLDLSTIQNMERLEIEHTAVTAASSERQRFTAIRITTAR